MGTSRACSPHAEPDGADCRGAAIVISKLGPAGGIARKARPGHLGRSRRTSRRSGADVGLAHGPPGGSRHACPSADLGIAARIRAAAGGSTRAELGRTAAGPSVATARSCSAGACVGRAAAGRRPAAFCATAFRATASAGAGSRAASRSCSAGRSAVLEFSSGGLRARASLGRAG